MSSFSLLLQITLYLIMGIMALYCMLVAWWQVNVMTTARSLRFHNPKITLAWFVTFPFRTLVGLAYVA